MKSRTIAVAGSIAALSFAATPIAAIAASSHHASSHDAKTARVDRSRDASGARHVDRTSERGSADTSRDIRGR